VADVVARTARRTPEAGRGCGRRSRLDLPRLDDAVSRAAAVLLGLDLAKGDRVAAYGKNPTPT